MAQMSMNKAIHGAVRRDLRRFLGALESFPDGDHDRAEKLAHAWANFDDQLTHHHEGEHEIAWPALEAIGATKEQIATMDAEHDVMAAALAAAGAAMATLKSSASGAHAEAAKVAVARLQEVTVSHFEHEEAELEPISFAHRDSPEIKEMGKKFAKVSPAKGGRFFAWVLDGASDDEKAAVTRDIPGPVLTIIGGIFGMGYRRKIAPVWKS
jgi:hemerythrin-like domain-containing protein